MKPPPIPQAAATIVVTTGNEIAGRTIQGYLGIVRGVVVRAPGFGATWTGSLKAISGGNIPEFSRLCEETRQAAYQEMLRHAAAMRADAVIGFRYDASGFMESCAEVLAYGTAVKLSDPV